MKKHLLYLLLGFALFSITSSCKTYRNVENLQPKLSKEIQEGPFKKESLSKLKLGDKILVQSISGEKYYLYYKQLNGSYLMGTLWKKDGEEVESNERLEIPIDSIEKLHVLRSSPGLTASVIIVGLAMAFGVVRLAFSSVTLGF